MSIETRLAVASAIACLFGAATFLLCVWTVFREIAFRRLDCNHKSDHASVIQELRVYFRQIDQIVLKIEGAKQLDEIQQREIRQMLQIIETRLLDAIQRFGEQRSTNIFNTQSEGGQTNQGQNVSGDQK